MTLVRKQLVACEVTSGCNGPPIAVWSNLQGKLQFACRLCDGKLSETTIKEKAARRMRDAEERLHSRTSAKELADGILKRRTA